ncbi:hypothetical protein EDC04DRAFT_2871475 [Pisolithus marmoratus]|nr:hypothetical protein EDC04DRAFT_2871475 [Pisolithus marmoratus]
MPPCRSIPQQREFNALHLPCNIPGCNHWFKNQLGLTQHKRNHQHLNHCSRVSPDYFKQGHGSNIIPPVPPIAKHVAGKDIHDEGPYDCNYSTTPNQEFDGITTEFVGPDNKVYHNYHAGLNTRRCDSLGHFLPDDAPLPLLPVQRSPDDWAPFCSQLEFELAEFLFQHAEMPANQINTLLEIWAVSILELGSSPPFTNHMDLYHVIDSMSVGEVKWEIFKITHKCKQDGQEGQDNVIELVQGHEDGQDDQEKPEAPWMSDVYDVWYRDLQQVVHNLLRCTDLKDEMDFVPYWEFDAAIDERCWEDFMLGDWAWDEAIIHNDPSTVRATLVPIILGSDKTTISIATGQTDYYPLYLSIGNVHNTTCHTHHNVVVLIGFLAMPKTTREHANTPAFRKFKKQLFHSSLGRILRSLRAAMTIPETVLFSDQYYRCVIYSLAAYIADYEEQVLLSGIMHNWCPKCLAYQETLDEDALWQLHEHTELVVKELDLQTPWKVYGIDRDIVPFTSGFPCADIQRMLSPDILHQLIKGRFKAHLVDWVEKYLYHTHSKSVIAAVTPFTGLQRFPQGQHFKQWTGDDSKGLMKVYIAAIEGYVPQDMVCTFHAFLEFCYLYALACFHLYREVFQDANIITTFSLPWQHAMKHYPYLICQFSALNGLCSSITESKHIKAVKRPYRHTNCFQALRQMLIINERLDKFAAAHADFERRGMLRGTCLSHFFEEDSGDTVDSPMSVKAHNVKDLAIKLDQPHLLNMLCHFLQMQDQHDDCDPEDVPLDKCPFYDGSIHVYNSISSTFYLPSDISGLHSMRPCYDCVFVITNPHVEGMLGLDITCVLCFFSFKYLGAEYPCAIIRWFDCVGDGPDPNTGMWKVRTHNAQDISIIHLDIIYRVAQLIPIYASHESVDPASVKPIHTFYVNKFADHHVFEIAY